jgi:hypothetical protein
MNDPLASMMEIIDLMIKSKVEDASQFIYRKEKENNITTSYFRYKGKPFMKIVNDTKSVIMYTYNNG